MEGSGSTGSLGAGLGYPGAVAAGQAGPRPLTLALLPGLPPQMHQTLGHLGLPGDSPPVGDQTHDLWEGQFQQYLLTLVQEVQAFPIDCQDQLRLGEVGTWPGWTSE